MNKQEALIQLSEADQSLLTIQAASAAVAQSINDLRTDITQAVVAILADEPTPDPPVDPVDFDEVITITDSMDLTTILAALRALPDNSLVLVEGPIPWFFIGGNVSKGAWRSNTEAFANITFRGNNTTAAMSPKFVDDVGGYDNIFFENLIFRPGADGQYAAVHCYDGTTGGFLSFKDCTFEAPGFTSYGGFGMKSCAVMVGNRYEFINCTFDPAQEHSIYDKNGQGDRLIQNCTNNTKTINIVGGVDEGTTFVGGNGRTF